MWYRQNDANCTYFRVSVFAKGILCESFTNFPMGVLNDTPVLKCNLWTLFANITTRVGLTKGITKNERQNLLGPDFFPF